MEQKQRIAFHEAGHAVAIHLNNKARKLPPIFFRIIFNDLNHNLEKEPSEYQAMQDDHNAKVEGGRLIEWLPTSIDALVPMTPNHHDAIENFLKAYMVAFEADIMNLLIGPLAETKYSYEREGEVFNYQLANLNTLKKHGGNSDLALINDYLQSFSASAQEQAKKLTELFDLA
ncbi:MAG: hypothetical protein PHI13_16345, partial [Methylococcales bacterium]|nr:hypothetical protein [Methylococcales bacterium]